MVAGDLEERLVEVAQVPFYLTVVYLLFVVVIYLGTCHTSLVCLVNPRLPALDSTHCYILFQSFLFHH